MSILPDWRLRELGPNLIEPFDPAHVQPSSIDVHLDRHFLRLQKDVEGLVLDPSSDMSYYFDAIDVEEKYGWIILDPDDFLLGSTFERVTFPDSLVGRFEGKSSLGRLGLLTHITAGFIDPGFEGHITLELKNVTKHPIVLFPGMKIGQLCFEKLEWPVRLEYGNPAYGSHYQGQRGPTLSRSHQNFKKVDVY